MVTPVVCFIGRVQTRKTSNSYYLLAAEGLVETWAEIGLGRLTEELPLDYFIAR